MLLTVGTTEAVEAIAEAQENLQEVAKNPGILRTYFQNLVPDLFVVWIYGLVCGIGG